MNGGRMRSNSLSGTRPAKTSRSVPRLMAPNSARTRTLPEPAGAATASRNSPRPGATYQRACPRIVRFFTTLACADIETGTALRISFSSYLGKSIFRYILNRFKGASKPFMRERSPRDDLWIAAPPLALRRLLFFSLVALTIAGLLALSVFALSANGFGLVDLVLVVLFAVTLPWYVIGFWNAVIGFLVMRFARDVVASVTPAAGLVHGEEPITP